MRNPGQGRSHPVKQHYTRMASVLHWLVAVLLGAQIILGLAMMHGGLSEAWSFALFQLHSELGLCVFIVIALRLLWRLTHRTPPLPQGMSRLTRNLAQGVHTALYILQGGAPISGWLLVSALALPVSFFGFGDVPLLSGVSEGQSEGAFRLMHHWAAWGLGGLVVVHTLAALHHRLIKGERIFDRINPFYRTGPDI